MTTAMTSRAIRSRWDDVSAVPRTVRSEWIKLSTVRASTAINWLTIILGFVSAWACARFANDPVQTVSQVFIFSTVLTGVLASISGVLLYTSEVQHGTLGLTLTAQPIRWIVIVAKTGMASARGLWLGAIGMAAGICGALVGGLELGSAHTLAVTAAWGLLFTLLAGVLGLGVGMVIQHSSAALAGVLVWDLVIENLLTVFAPDTASRFLPFVAGNNLLGIVGKGAFAENAATALTRTQDALVFGSYVAIVLALGTALVYRRDTN